MSRKFLHFLLPSFFSLSFSLGCAYYNTFFNAQRDYAEAMNQKESSQSKTAPPHLLDKCIERCGKVIKFYPDSKWLDDAILLMGKCYYEKSEYEKALTKFEELTTHFPRSPLVQEALYMSGQVHLRHEKWAAAITSFERGTHVGGKLGEECALKISESHFMAGQFGEAVETGRSFGATYPKSRLRGEALLVVGDALFEMESFEEAIEAYTEVLRLNPKKELFFRASLRIGDSYLRLDRVEEALEALLRLRGRVLDAKEEASLSISIAESQRALGKFGEAISTLKGVTAKVPRTEEAQEAFYKMGLIYEEDLSELEKAKEAYDKVRERGSSSEYLEKALLRSSAIGRLTSYRQALGGGEESDLAKTQFLLAELYLIDLDRPNQAVEAYQKVVSDFPESEYGPKAAFALGWVHETVKGDSLEAIKAYRRVIAQYPGTPYASSSAEALRRLSAQADTLSTDGREDVPGGGGGS